MSAAGKWLAEGQLDQLSETALATVRDIAAETIKTIGGDRASLDVPQRASFDERFAWQMQEWEALAAACDAELNYRFGRST